MADNQAKNQQKKSPQTEAILEAFSEMFLAKPRSKAFPTKTCVMCGGSADVFTNKLSEKEYSISGMCQNCQDNFFE